MEFVPFQPQDLLQINEIQPPGWGDLVPRFQYFIEQPFCHPATIKQNGKLVAVGTSIAHADSAWLATIIVHPEERGKGYGRAITEYLMEQLDPKTYSTIFLDATDLGFPVYNKIGFELETEYHHFKKEGLLPAMENKNCVPANPDQQQKILQLDLEFSDEDRRNSLFPCLSNAQLYLNNGEITGYFLPDLGEGHIIAQDENAGLALMRQRMVLKNIAALPAENLNAIAYLKTNGFAFFRNSRRMFYGKKRKVEFSRMYNRISGQLG